MKKQQPVVMSKKTLQLVKKLNREYAKIQAKENDTKARVINIDKRIQLEMDLLRSIRDDVWTQQLWFVWH